MNYYQDCNSPSYYYVSNTTNLDIDILTNYYRDNSTNCLVVSAVYYKSYVTTTICKFITDGEYLRIFNAAKKVNLTIYVVGSRANGTASESSDWDYIIEGITNRKWKSIRNSLPGSKSIDNPMNKVDLMHTPLDETRPYIAISPYRLLNDNLSDVTGNNDYN